MNGLDFMDFMSDVDIKYAIKANERPVRHKVQWQHYIALAACFALTVFSGAMLFFGSGSDTSSMETSDGLATTIGSSTGLLWLSLGAGILGMIVAIVLIAKGKKEPAEQDSPVL